MKKNIVLIFLVLVAQLVAVQAQIITRFLDKSEVALANCSYYNTQK